MKNKKFLIILSIVFLFGIILTPFLTHIFSPYVPSQITADGILSYIIGALSAAATYILALVALYQTNQANALSARMLELEEAKNKLDTRPFIIVSGWRGIEIKDKNKVLLYPDKMYIQADPHDDGELAGLELSLYNVTDGFLSASFDSAKSEVAEWKNSYASQQKMDVAIKPNEAGTFTFIGSPDFFKNQEGKKIHFSFILINRIGNRYKQEFDAILMRFSNECCHNQGEYYCHLFVQDYKIEKFVKTDGKTELIPEEL